MAIDKAILKEAIEIFKKAKPSSSLVAVAKEINESKAFTKKAVCRALEISRASIYKTPKVIDMAFYRKADDNIYLPIIRQVIDKRPTYGYKRVAALTNRILKVSTRSPMNRKRVYRLMKMHGLILPKAGEKRTNHEGTGQVMTLYPNTRLRS